MNNQYVEDISGCQPDWLTAEHSTGTSIMAVEFADGVVIGADSRTTTGSYIANRVTDKLTSITDHIYCCRSGSAADTQAIADVVKYHLSKYTLNFSILEKKYCQKDLSDKDVGNGFASKLLPRWNLVNDLPRPPGPVPSLKQRLSTMKLILYSGMTNVMGDCFLAYLHYSVPVITSFSRLPMFFLAIWQNLGKNLFRKVSETTNS